MALLWTSLKNRVLNDKEPSHDRKKKKQHCCIYVKFKNL